MNDDVLSKAFARFPSFNMARVSFQLLGFFQISFLLAFFAMSINSLQFLFRFLYEVHRAVIFLCFKVGCALNLHV